MLRTKIWTATLASEDDDLDNDVHAFLARLRQRSGLSKKSSKKQISFQSEWHLRLSDSKKKDFVVASDHCFFVMHELKCREIWLSRLIDTRSSSRLSRLVQIVDVDAFCLDRSVTQSLSLHNFSEPAVSHPKRMGYASGGPGERVSAPGNGGPGGGEAGLPP